MVAVSGDNLRELAENSNDWYIAAVDGSQGELLAHIRATLYTAAAEIIDALPTEEERLRNAILTGLLATAQFPGYEQTFEDATKQARAILAERAGGER